MTYLVLVRTFDLITAQIVQMMPFGGALPPGLLSDQAARRQVDNHLADLAGAAEHLAGGLASDDQAVRSGHGTVRPVHGNSLAIGQTENERRLAHGEGQAPRREVDRLLFAVGSEVGKLPATVAEFPSAFCAARTKSP